MVRSNWWSSTIRMVLTSEASCGSGAPSLLGIRGPDARSFRGWRQLSILTRFLHAVCPMQYKKDPRRMSGRDPLVTQCSGSVACRNVSKRLRRARELADGRVPSLQGPPRTRPPLHASIARVLTFRSNKDSALIHSHSCTFKFTIDIRPGLLYPFACYLEQTCPTPPITSALTLGLSISCSLLVVSKKVISFGIKQIQPLFANHSGWGTSAHPRHASHPPSCAPRGTSIPCGLNRLPILPVTTGRGTPPAREPLESIPVSVELFPSAR